MITLVIIPAANTLDNDPIVYDSKEDTNWIDSKTRDNIDERAHNKANLITSKLYIDRDNLPSI